MTTREQLFLTPYEKMTLFHRFPCKLVLDTLLVILVSVQVSREQGRAVRQAEHQLCSSIDQNKQRLADCVVQCARLRLLSSHTAQLAIPILSQ